MGTIVCKRELAEIFGWSPRSITNWQGESPPLPIARIGKRGTENAYDVGACLRWWLERQQRRAAAHTAADVLDLKRAEMLDLQIAEKRATLIPAVDLVPGFEAFVAHIRAACDRVLEQYPQRTAELQTPGEHYALFREAVDEILQAGADYQPQIRPAAEKESVCEA